MNIRHELGNLATLLAAVALATLVVFIVDWWTWNMTVAFAIGFVVSLVFSILRGGLTR